MDITIGQTIDFTILIGSLIGAVTVIVVAVNKVMDRQFEKRCGGMMCEIQNIKDTISQFKNQKESLKCLLRSNITSKYYVYKSIGEVPFYEKENMNYLYSQYKSMKGNSYVDELMEDFNNLPIKEM